MPRHLRNILILFGAVILFSACSLLDRKNVGGLQVITDEVVSSLFLNDQYLDKTPYINKEIKPGNYTLRLEPDNPELVSYETQVVVRQGALTVVTWNPSTRPETSGGIIYELEEISSNQGQLSFITIPDNALIKLDNRENEFSPLIVKDLEPGHHQFEISLTSYQSQLHTINVPKGHLVHVTAKLAKEELDESNEATEVNESTPSGTVTVLPTNFFRDGEEVLRVRGEASVSAQSLGFVKVGQNYPYQEERVGGWLKIIFEGADGWISQRFAQIN